MNHHRFTARGGAEVEQRIAGMVAEVADLFQNTLSPQDYRALVMIGGYGRGEGGVVVAEGREYPHNNLDFLLIGRRLAPHTRDRLHASVERLRQKFGLGIDLSFTTPFSLRTARPLVIWYDMRFGHKTILGDDAFVPSLTRFELNRIPSEDMRDLLVNRGTLLLINDLILEAELASVEHRKTVVRHVMKSVIGYGDALLFRNGAYDWSYEERQRRMRRLERGSESFRNLYDEAMEFRFRPDYARYLERDLKTWQAELRSRLAPIHLEFESWRLGRPELAWADYLPTALARVVGEQPFSIRAWLRKILNCLAAGGYSEPAPWRVKLGFRCGGGRNVLSLLFPLLAYHLEDARYRQRAAAILASPSSELSALRDTYLAQWAVYGDVNFPTLLSRLGIDRPLLRGAGGDPLHKVSNR